MPSRNTASWMVLLLIGGCVLERVEPDAPEAARPATAEEDETLPRTVPEPAGRAPQPVRALREVPLASAELGGQIAERRPEGATEGTLLLAQDEQGMWVVGYFEGPAQEGGAVMLAPTVPLRALREARANEGPVVFISAPAEREAGGSASETGDAVVCSGPRFAEWVEEVAAERGVVEVQPSEREGLEVTTIHVSFLDDLGNERTGWVRFEYDPQRLDGGLYRGSITF